jgi:thiol-disulfide isomerase/thioredoxin
MIERLVISIALFAVGFGLYVYLTRRQVKRLSTMSADTDSILHDLKPGIPAIVYFTTPHCIPCLTQQQPALAHVIDALGDDNIQIIKIDATENPDSADRWGVMAAPTTFIVDKLGTVKAVNHGVTDANKLQRQLQMTA